MGNTSLAVSPTTDSLVDVWSKVDLIAGSQVVEGLAFV